MTIRLATQLDRHSRHRSTPECPFWVMSGHSTRELGMSAFRLEPDLATRSEGDIETLSLPRAEPVEGNREVVDTHLRHREPCSELHSPTFTRVRTHCPLFAVCRPKQ